MSSEFSSLINIFSKEIYPYFCNAFKYIVNLSIIENLISENFKIKRRKDIIVHKYIKDIIVHNIYIFKINFRWDIRSISII